MTNLVGTDETCHAISLTSDTFGQFRPVPPPKSPWHAACNYSNIINAHTRLIMADLAIPLEHAFVNHDGTVSVSYNGARLQLSAAGFHLWSNVQVDSEVYRAMNDTAYAALTAAAPIEGRHRTDRIMYVAIRGRTTMRAAEMVLESEGWDVERAIRNILAIA